MNAPAIVTGAAPKFTWNTEGTVLKTEDGFYGGLSRHDELGYIWSVTPPSGPVRRGSATEPRAARFAVEHHIALMRSGAAHG